MFQDDNSLQKGSSINEFLNVTDATLFWANHIIMFLVQSKRVIQTSVWKLARENTSNIF